MKTLTQVLEEVSLAAQRLNNIQSDRNLDSDDRYKYNDRAIRNLVDLLISAKDLNYFEHEKSIVSKNGVKSGT